MNSRSQKKIHKTEKAKKNENWTPTHLCSIGIALGSRYCTGRLGKSVIELNACQSLKYYTDREYNILLFIPSSRAFLELKRKSENVSTVMLESSMS